MSAGDDDGELISRLAPFAGFADIARRNHKAMIELQGQLRAEPRFVSPEDDDEAGEAEHNSWQSETRQTRRNIGEHAVVTVLMACAAVELYINDAAARLLGQEYFEKHFDRVEIKSKWMILPRIVAQHKMDPQGKAIRLLTSLVKARNNLMHPKSKPWTEAHFKKQRPEDVEGSPEYLVKAASDAIKALDALHGEISKWDNPAFGKHHLLGPSED